MNRKEFLAQLSRLLWDIPEADRKDALEYYENYFEVESSHVFLHETSLPRGFPLLSCEALCPF